MAIGDKRVIRWPFELTAANNAIVFADSTLTVSTTQTIPAGIYRTNDDGTADDFVLALKTVCDAAYTALYGAGTPVTTGLHTTGRIQISNTSGATNSLYIVWSDPLTTLPKYHVGEDSTTIRLLDTVNGSFPYVAGHQWLPNRLHTDDAPERDAHTVRKNKGVNGIVDYVLHSDLDAPARRRRTRWEDVIGARMLQSLADDAIAAPLAGLAVGDTGAAFENLARYRYDADTPTPGQVYIYSTNDPATHVEEGPYHLELPDEVDAFGGADWTMEREDLRQRRFALELRFVLV